MRETNEQKFMEEMAAGHLISLMEEKITIITEGAVLKIDEILEKNQPNMVKYGNVSNFIISEDCQKLKVELGDTVDSCLQERGIRQTLSRGNRYLGFKLPDIFRRVHDNLRHYAELRLGLPQYALV